MDLLALKLRLLFDYDNAHYSKISNYMDKVEKNLEIILYVMLV